MEIVSPSWGFYALSLVVSGLLFFLFRRLFRRLFRSETVVLIATAMAAIILSPIIMLGFLWVLNAVTHV